MRVGFKKGSQELLCSSLGVNSSGAGSIGVVDSFDSGDKKTSRLVSIDFKVCV